MHHNKYLKRVVASNHGLVVEYLPAIHDGTRRSVKNDDLLAIQFADTQSAGDPGSIPGGCSDYNTFFGASRSNVRSRPSDGESRARRGRVGDLFLCRKIEIARVEHGRVHFDHTSSSARRLK